MPKVLFVADADAAGREALVAGLSSAGAADLVVGCDTGRSLLTEYTRALRMGDVIAGVVLDTKLAAGGGKSSAIALRAVEKGFGAAPVSFVFHVTTPLDDNLQRVMDYLGHATYMQKTDGDGAVDALIQAMAEAEAS